MQPCAPVGSTRDPSLRGCLGLWHICFKDSDILIHLFHLTEKQASQQQVVCSGMGVRVERDSFC